MNAPEPAVAHEPTQLVPLDFIAESPTNPRTDFPAAEMAELIESVRRHGVLQPVLMRPWPESYAHKGANPPKFELVAGARRFRAAKAAELQNIEAKIRNLTDHEVLEIQIIENLCREGLHPMDEAHGYEQMIDHYGYTAETLAEKIGKSKAYVYARLKLTALCHDARKAFREGKLNASTALLIARIPIDKLQAQATKEITDPDWKGDTMSVRRAQDHLQTKYMLRLVEAPFPTKDADLLKETGSCEACPKRTGNQPAGLFDDVKSADVCTDPDCYAKKKAAHIAKTAAAAKKSGQEVITGKAAKAIAPHGTQYLDDAKLVKLDDKCDDDPKHRTYRQMLGDKAPEPKLLEDVKTGHMVEVVEKKQLTEALKKAGVVKPKNAQNTAVSKEEKAAELEETFRKALLANVRNELVNRMRNDGAGLTLDEARLVTEKTFSRLWDNSRHTVAKLWLPDMKATEAVESMRERISTMPPDELCLLQMDMSLINEIPCHRYNYQNPPEPLIDAAKRLGIDPDEIRKEVKREAAEKAKPSTQAARAAKPDARGKGEPNEHAVATTEASALKVGDRVRVKDDAKGETGKRRKCCGRIGTINDEGGAYIHVLFNDGTFVSNLRRDEVEKLPLETPTTAAPKPAHDEIKVGDRVRAAGGDEGTVERIMGKKCYVVFERNGRRVTRPIPAANLEKIPAATQAAPAAEQTAKATIVVPAAEWPFPTFRNPSKFIEIEKNEKAAATAAKGEIETNERPSAGVKA